MAKKEEQKGISVKKEENFSDWYTEVIQKADLADYTSVSGCMTFKPYAYLMWEILQKVIDKEFKKIGIQNCYFPMLIPESLLKKEAKHVEGFSPEVAWVTHAGNSKLKERLAVRPTSETIMYESFAKWIRSWRDLPLRLNQWNNVIRWEFKHPVALLRTREFLWNEGHTAFATESEALKEKDQVMAIYQSFLNDYMALFGVTGMKTEKEKFAGAQATYAIELFLPSGKAIQGPDFHLDSQNFSKAFGIKFLDKEENKDKIISKAKEIKNKIKKYSVSVDDRDEYNPGWKFNEWELKGVPLRVEIGPKDLEKNQVILVRRDTNYKKAVKLADIEKEIDADLDSIQKNLLNKAKKFFHDNIVEASNFNDFIKNVKNKKLVKAFFCGNVSCEDAIKDKSGGATSRIIPYEQPKKIGKCVHCGKEGKFLVYFGKAY